MQARQCEICFCPFFQSRIKNRPKSEREANATESCCALTHGPWLSRRGRSRNADFSLASGGCELIRQSIIPSLKCVNCLPRVSSRDNPKRVTEQIEVVAPGPDPTAMASKSPSRPTRPRPGPRVFRRLFHRAWLAWPPAPLIRPCGSVEPGLGPSPWLLVVVTATMIGPVFPGLRLLP